MNVISQGGKDETRKGKEPLMNSSISGLKLVQPPSIVPRKLLHWMGIISILGAIGAVVADLLLQYDPQGNYSTIAPLTIALWRVLAGHFLGVFSIPLEITGYWVVCTILTETAPRLFRALFWIMAYAIVIGTVFHGTVSLFILVEQTAHNVIGTAQVQLLSLQNTIQILIAPLSVFFLVCYLVTWSIVVVTILRTSTRYPKWSVLFVPALGSLIITGIYKSHIVPLLGNILFPTVLSLPHLIFFLLSTIVLFNKTR